MDIFNSHELGPTSSDFYQSQNLTLRRAEIRVLRLRRGLGQTGIDCNLEKRKLKKLSKESPKTENRYNALSYRWGSPWRPRKVTCNNHDFYVTRNLYSALVHLRSSDYDTFLWIDAICINQNDMEEKAKQIKRMDEIYRHSSCTIIWLGKGGLLTREAFRVCSAYARATRDPNMGATQGRLSYVWPFIIILLLLRNEYFSRVWVIQEVALSQSIQVVCGDQQLSWSDFTLAIIPIILPNLANKNDLGIGNILVARASLPWTDQSGMADSAWIFQTMTNKQLPHPDNILSTAALFRRSEATDPVDKIFSLLGLCEHIQPGGTYAILPKYSQCNCYHKNEVYVGTARKILSSQRSLKLFSAVNRRPPRNTYLQSLIRWFCGRRRQKPALPTWVPDWSDKGCLATPLGLLRAQNTGVEANQNGALQFGSYRPRRSGYSLHIRLSGCRVNEIVDLGEVCNTEKSQRSIWFCLRYSFTTAENHRLETLSKWESQFRTYQFGRTWDDFIDTVTCGSGTTYEEGNTMLIIQSFRSRNVNYLPKLVQIAYAFLLALPLAVSAWEGGGLKERIVIYWCVPVATITFMWYCCFQLVPNFNFFERHQDENNNFLQADFEHMELRRLARLEDGSLALVPEASCLGDQIWLCEGGIMPLALRPKGKDFEMVGECYSATALQTALESRSFNMNAIRVV